MNWFSSLAEAERIIEDWRADYNQNRPDSSLKYQTPEEFAANRPFHKPQWAASLELRNQRFFSLDELNAAIRPLMDQLNGKVTRHLGTSRRDLFETQDGPALKPLPVGP